VSAGEGFMALVLVVGIGASAYLAYLFQAFSVGPHKSGPEQPPDRISEGPPRP
jgi:hypothetical protein